MSKFIPIILASGLISFLATPLLRMLAQRINFVDRPEARKAHLTPVPMLGGVAIYLGLATAVAFSGTSTQRELIGVLGGATVVTALGVWDDRYGMSPLVKILGQATAAALLIWSGIQVSLFKLPDAANIALTALWVIGIINAINFLDNMDGLAAGIASVASAFFFILAIVEDLGLVAALAAATLGAAVAFLYYNFNPASLFMGDAGSMLLGFVLAVLGIKLEFKQVPQIISWMIPIMILGLPIFDTTLVVLSRIRRGRPVYQGGKDHTSHRLVTILGMTPTRSVTTLYLIASMLGMLALIIRDSNQLQAYLILGILAALFAIMLFWLEWRFEPRQPKLPPDSTP